MNITKHTLGAAALTLTLTIGGASVALAGDNEGGADREAKIAQICADPDAAIAKLTERQTKVSERIAKLTELRTKATEAGRTKLVTKIERRLDRLQTALDRIAIRIDKAPTWIAENCS